MHARDAEVQGADGKSLDGHLRGRAHSDQGAQRSEVLNALQHAYVLVSLLDYESGVRGDLYVAGLVHRNARIREAAVAVQDARRKSEHCLRFFFFAYYLCDVVESLKAEGTVRRKGNVSAECQVAVNPARQVRAVLRSRYWIRD